MEMDKAGFFKIIEEQFQETEIGTLKMESNFKEVPEWGSLVALCIIAAVDENYNKTLSGDDLDQCSTVEELYHLVNNK